MNSHTTMEPTREARSLYQEWLQSSRESLATTAIPNELPWHSQIAAYELMKHALDMQKEHQREPVTVRILTGTLSPMAYTTQWFSLAARFVEAGGIFRVVVWNERISDVVGASLSQHNLSHHKSFEIRLSRTRRMGEQINHFLLVGESAYRHEAAHKYGSSRKVGGGS